jgi:membrane-associated phospholipid phosphatase
MALPTETITIAYAALLFVVGAFRRLRGRRGSAAVLASASWMGLILLMTQRASPSLRCWSVVLYLVIGYWIPALMVQPNDGGRFAEWLPRTDRRFTRVQVRVPTAVIHLADTCYLLCYPLVPAAYAVLMMFASELEQRRFWVAVLAAGYACYVSLPWLVSLPPRLIESTGGRRPVANMNDAVLARVSHGYNTFPSGHAAVSTAVALSCASVPAAAVLFGALAVGIAVGAVVGRHHYVIDVIAGVGIGVICVLATQALV